MAAIPAHGSDVDMVTTDDYPDARPHPLAIEPNRLDVDLATLIKKGERLPVERGLALGRGQ